MHAVGLRFDKYGLRTDFGVFYDNTNASLDLLKTEIESIHKGIRALEAYLNVEIKNYLAVEKLKT